MMFSITSRYFNTPTATLETAEGKKVVYLLRRFVPPPERFDLLLEHTVTEGERLDNITAQYLGDPEQFWRVCDANGAIRPDELTETIGRRLRITLPEGIPGAPHA
ncbi:MAG: LysM peptidoglycan-binding domain-containing protein [Candidatus Tectomicrobia bacterium]|uniref:LysM peptidoglycan-binding domain-containing protein n=1 Tax=Tectimicrobiota bacterium TaxID=2528274 RepID=A0A932CPE6_UNCTE|nr:LysM peptidoglycan-binding domain-containing protein [Candidatus Tectomicrobia bacterium]